MVNSGQSPGVEVVFHSAEMTNSDVFSLSTWESSGKVGLRTNGTNPMKQNPLRNGATTTGVASTASTHVTCHQQNRISRILSSTSSHAKVSTLGYYLPKNPASFVFADSEPYMAPMSADALVLSHMDESFCWQ
jgi:hypothetical protein